MNRVITCFMIKRTTRLYVQLKKLNQETGYSTKYIGELPPLDSVLARVHYLYPDLIAKPPSSEKLGRDIHSGNVCRPLLLPWDRI